MFIISVISVIISVLSTIYYGPNIISIIVTKGGYPSSSGLYKTSGTIGQGVTESYKSLVYKNIKTWEYTRRINVPTYRYTQLLLWGGVIYLSI